ncbi:MAG: nucleotidyltransferase family protein, partial [Pedobacter sp.]
MHNTGIIILAAGNSSRLGRPKQLLSYNGKSLICNIVDVALVVN